MATAKYKWTRAEEDALRDGVRKHGPGKWRTIQKDPELGDILRARSNVELKDKWRNMGEAGALDAADATGGAEEEREASDREHAEGGGKRRRRDGDEAETSNAKGKENAMDAVTNALFNETQRVKREASAAEAEASAAVWFCVDRQEEKHSLVMSFIYKAVYWKEPLNCLMSLVVVL